MVMCAQTCAEHVVFVHTMLTVRLNAGGGNDLLPASDWPPPNFVLKYPQYCFCFFQGLILLHSYFARHRLVTVTD